MDDLDLLMPAGEQQSAPMDFGKFFAGFWKRKYIILLLTLIGAAWFFWDSKNEKPVYSTFATIKTRSFDTDAEGILSRDRQAELRSRSFAERVTARMGLALQMGTKAGPQGDVFSEFHTTTTPTPGKYKIQVDDNGTFSIYLVEYPKETLLDSISVWDAISKEYTYDGLTFRLNPRWVESPQFVNFRIRPFERAVAELNTMVTAEVSKNGNLMKLTIKGEDRDHIADQLNQIADIYVQETLLLRDRDANTYRKRLEGSLEVAAAKVREADADLRNFFSKYPLSLDAAKRTILDEMQRNSYTLREIPQQREQLTQLLEKLGEPVLGSDPEQYRRLIVRQLANFSAMRDEPALALLRDQLDSQEKQLGDLMRDYSNDYAPLVSLRASIRETQDNIIAFASNYRNTLAQKESETRVKMADIQAQQRMLPDDEYRLMELERNKKVSEDHYTTLYTKLQKLEIADGGEGEDFAVLDRAIKPTVPINPSQSTKVFIGAALGLVAGLALSLGIDLADRHIRTPGDVDRHLKLKVLGAIPNVDFKDIPEYHDHEKAKQIDRQLVTHDYSPTPIGEAYRALRTQIIFSRTHERPHSIAITSVAPEEGKSFTASNLAIIFAQQRTNTLLVDADLRRGVLHNTFQMRREPGLANYLSSSVTLSSIVQQTHVPNLSFISCGVLLPNPSELLGSPLMRRFLDEASRKFDIVLFDTPPLDAATDAVVLGTQVNAVVLVVRAGKTRIGKAKEKMEIFNTVPVKLVGAVLNSSDTQLVQNYSYYHY
ncbi:MAG TPA: polysaccharide biosynthesis tyrosine autokinase [bacterium]|nr:polysaccharide biosynthesis tyrosine autokinase [bacterium]